MNEYLDQIDINDLPESLKDVANLCGDTVALALLQHYAGRRLFVPARGFPEGHPLKTCLTDQEETVFCKTYQGATLLIPVGQRALQKARNRLICRDRACGATISALSARYHLCERQILAILADCPDPTSGTPAKY